MTTTDKDFVVKNGLIVQGAQGTIDGSVIVTEAALNTSLGDYVALTEKGSADGVAELDASQNVLTKTAVVFEGATVNTSQTTLDVIDPTADRTITLPNVSGTVVTTGNQNDAYPSQSGQTGKYLKTDGTNVSWSNVTANNETLTIGTGLSGTSYNGSSAVTIAIDSTVATTSGSQTLTNKTLTSPVISSITNTGTLTLPTSTDTLVGRATTDTLTNKTLTSPVISTITNTGTLTLPTSTDTLVGRATTDTLTNKTLTSPTISTISGNTTINVAATNTAAVLWNTTLTTGSISTGGSLTTGGVNIANGTTFAGTVAIANASTSAHTVSVSNGAGVANKTINIGTASTGGTTNITIGSNSGATSNVTIHGLTASSIKNTGTLTLPTSTDTLVGRATTDTLTNKTLGASNALGADFSAATYKITNLGTPSASTDAATKQYVDDLAQGLHIHASCVAATTSNLNANYSNGTDGVGATLVNAGALAAFSVDGVSPTQGSRILVKNQSTTFQNGIYTLSTVGSTSVAWVLTRALDFNEPAEIDGGDFTFVTGGTAGDNTGWVQTETVTTIGSDAILFTQFSGAGTYLAGNGLTLTSNTFSINTSITADTSTAQTLTNKTISGANNTLTVRLANDISGFGTGIATALAVNTGSSGAPVLFNGALGTPSSGTLTNATGLPVTSGISGLGTGIATFLETPSSANLLAAVTDETGSGALVFATSPTLTTPNLGTPSALTLTNATGLPVTGITASTSAALGVGSIELGNATDTTIARSAAGVVTIEGVEIVTLSRSQTLTNKTLTLPTINNPRFGYTTTATAAATSTLTSSSNYLQYFTGTTTQTVTLPVASTMTLGQGFFIENNSTGNLTVNSSGGNLVVTIIPGTTVLITCILTSGTTAASWDVTWRGFSSITGTGSNVLATAPTISNLVLSGTLNAGGGNGTSGQVLSSTGTGVQWTTPASGGAALSEFLLMGG